MLAGTLLSTIRRSIADIFRIQVISNTDVRSPIITLGSTSFFHVRHENLYIVALTKWNANAALIFEFCYRVINVGRSYFGKFDEEAVKANFVLIYELLDGMSATFQFLFLPFFLPYFSCSFTVLFLHSSSFEFV